MGRLQPSRTGRPAGKLKQAARAAYLRDAGSGLVGGLFDAADYGLDRVEVWPENWPAWVLFCRLGTQWRIAMSGPTGLDYGPLTWLLDLEDLTAEERRERFDDVRTLEAAALDQMRNNEP